MRKLLLIISIIILSLGSQGCKKDAPASQSDVYSNGVKKGDNVVYKIILPTGVTLANFKMIMFLDMNGDNIIQNDCKIRSSGLLYGFTALVDNQAVSIGFVAGIGSIGAKVQITVNNKVLKEATVTSEGFTTALILN